MVLHAFIDVEISATGRVETSEEFIHHNVSYADIGITPIELTNSTISGNSAGDAGGGLYSQDGPVTITFSTLVNNIAAVDGGGVYVEDGGLNANSSIITGNNVPANAQFFAFGAVVDDNNLINVNAQLGGSLTMAGHWSVIRLAYSK